MSLAKVVSSTDENFKETTQKIIKKYEENGFPAKLINDKINDLTKKYDNNKKQEPEIKFYFKTCKKSFTR